MAYASDLHGTYHGLFDRVSATLKAFAEARAKRRLFVTTLRELRTLSGRDLADLGIAASEIPFIAREAAYGSK